MKSIIAIIVVVCALCINANVIQKTKVRDPKGLSSAIAQMFAQKIAREWRAQDTRAPVITPVDDPLNIELIELNFSGEDGISGQIKLSDAVAVGTSSLVDNLLIVLTIPARATYTLSSGRLSIEGRYSADALIDGGEDGHHHFVGDGPVSGEIVGLQVRVDVRITVNLITNRFVVNSVAIPILDFDSVQGLADGLLYNGELVDWDAVNEDAKPVFDAFWDENQVLIELEVKIILADLLKDCRIDRIIAGDYTCMGATETSSKSNSRLFTQALKYLI